MKKTKKIIKSRKKIKIHKNIQLKKKIINNYCQISTFNTDRPCKRGSKNKKRYTRKEIESLYLKCFTKTSKRKLSKKNMNIICNDLKELKKKYEQSALIIQNKFNKGESIYKNKKNIIKLNTLSNNIEFRKILLKNITSGHLINNLMKNIPLNIINDIIIGKKIQYPSCDIFTRWKNTIITFLNNEKGVYGFPFKVENRMHKIFFGVKLIPFLANGDINKELYRQEMLKQDFKNYSDINKYIAKSNSTLKDPLRSENVELKILNILSDFIFNKITPHLILPIATFTCKKENILKMLEKSGQTRAFKFMYKDSDNYLDNINIILCEWAAGGNLKDFIKKYYKNWFVIDPALSTTIFSIIFFQFIYTLTTVQKKYPGFRHNDLKVDNVLVKKTISVMMANVHFTKQKNIILTHIKNYDNFRENIQNNIIITLFFNQQIIGSIKTTSPLLYKYGSYEITDYNIIGGDIYKYKGRNIYTVFYYNTILPLQYTSYEINSIEYIIPDFGFNICLWDFDMSAITGIIRNYRTIDMEKYGIRETPNKYYDLYCFFNYLRIWVLTNRNFVTDYIKNTWRWIIPLKYRHNEYKPYYSDSYLVYWSRIVIDDEYTTAENSLNYFSKKGGIFYQFLQNKSSNFLEQYKYS